MPFRRGSRNSKVELLRGVSLFSACSNRELTRIASLADEIAVPEGRVLIRQGEPGREFFVIVHGKARVSARGKKAKTLGPGAGMGELALLDQGPRSATVTATSDMYLLVLDSRSFSSLIAEVPSVAGKIFRVMAERLRESERGRRALREPWAARRAVPTPLAPSPQRGSGVLVAWVAIWLATARPSSGFGADTRVRQPKPPALKA